MTYKLSQDNEDLMFNRKIIKRENTKIVIQEKYSVPPPYNGMYKDRGSKNNPKKELLEVTYENKRDLTYYDTQEKLIDQMLYVYENFISQKEYQTFWNKYRKKYFDLKERYREAYDIE